LLVCVTETKNACDLMDYAARLAGILGRRVTLPSPDIAAVQAEKKART
jgi:hypothetical protein